MTMIPYLCVNISLSECNSGTSQKFPFEVNNRTELRNTATTFDNDSI